MTKTPRKRVLRFYRNKAGEICWSYKAANGKTRADGSEGYRRLASAENGALDVIGGTGLTRVPDTGHGEVTGRPDVRVEWDL
jgi:uncharacterized protein YegP (UPF0339 family)